MELGESVEEALYREISEETELKVEKKQLLWIHEFIEKPYHAIEFYFKCEIVGGELKRGVDPELESDQQMLMDLAFIPLSEVKNFSVEPPFVKEFCENGAKFFTDVRHVKNSHIEGAKGDGQVS